jgi:hypothetical protein
MSDELTHILLSSILCLIQRDLIRYHCIIGAAPCCHCRYNCHGNRGSTTRTMEVESAKLSYCPMEPMPSPPCILMRMPRPPFEVPYTMPQRGSIDLGRLTGPPVGITSFTVAGKPQRHQRRDTMAIEPLV